MYTVGEIAYAGELKNNITVIDVEIVNDMCLLVTFDTKEKRVFDCTELLHYPIFKRLSDKSIFSTVSIERGVIIWQDGEIDISPEVIR